jgi:hypothetical protein
MQYSRFTPRLKLLHLACILGLALLLVNIFKHDPTKMIQPVVATSLVFTDDPLRQADPTSVVGNSPAISTPAPRDIDVAMARMFNRVPADITYEEWVAPSQSVLTHSEFVQHPFSSSGSKPYTPLDRILRQVLTEPGGFFIESGAHDGVFQSNTLAFERFFGWRGLLIEPASSNIPKIMANRKRSIVLQVGLVSRGQDGIHVSDPGGAPGAKMKVGAGRVIGREFSMLLDELNITQIDFWSLDVEGQELLVLQGVNFEKHRPAFILIEVWRENKNQVFALMQENSYERLRGYDVEGGISGFPSGHKHRDYLFRDSHLNTRLPQIQKVENKAQHRENTLNLSHHVKNPVTSTNINRMYVHGRITEIVNIVSDKNHCSGQRNMRKCKKNVLKLLNFNKNICQVQSVITRRSKPTPWATIGDMYFTGNDYLDLFVYDIFFKTRKTNGFYVEIGASDGIAADNTLFFDDCLQWKGLLLEASACAICQVPMNRPSAIIENVAIGAIGTSLDPRVFARSFCTSTHPHCVETKKTLTTVPCFPVQYVLDKHNVTMIDFLSIDIEEHSEFALDTINLTKVSVGVILVECRQRSWCENKLITYGFDYVWIGHDILGWNTNIF